MTTTRPSPTLAPPGAGIPAIERWIGGARLALLRRLRSREAISERFRRERGAIDRLRVSAGGPACAIRVLVPRLRGLEDSSRFWSIWMTLDHLRIVNAQIAMVVQSLSRGQSPPGTASTAAVKPSADAGPDVLAGHEAACDHLLEIVASAPALRTRCRFPHPWFGPLDAAGWHAMAAMHMGIHRAQIEHILRGLPIEAPRAASGPTYARA